MERRTLVAVILIFVFVALDVAWAILNYLIPLLLFGSFDLIPIIPGNAMADWLIMWYLLPVLGIPFYLLMAIITPRWLLIPLNNLLNPGAEDYYFSPPKENPQPVSVLLRRAIFTLMITMGAALTVAKYFGWAFFNWNPALPDFVNIWNIYAIVMPIAFIILGIIIPASWLIEDSRIVFHSKEGSGGQELLGGGRILIMLLAGYATISVILDYSWLLANITLIYITASTSYWPWVPPWFVILITILNPVIYIYMPLLALIAYYYYLPTLQRRLVAFMDSRGTRHLSQVAVTDIDISDYLGSKNNPPTTFSSEQPLYHPEVDK
jgi:hypothetical protein